MESDEDSHETGGTLPDISYACQNIQLIRDSYLRRVSFPEHDKELVTGYLEPLDPLRLARNVDKNELLREYASSCSRHNTIPIDSVVDQIKKFNIDNDRVESFVLKTATLTCGDCESLEEVLKRVQFNYIYLVGGGLNSETAYTLFEMFEYYESAVHLHVMCNIVIEARGWQAASRYLKKSNTLEEFAARDLKLSDKECELLIKPLSAKLNLQIIKLENSNMTGSHLSCLVDALCVNKTIKEVYLPHNKMGLLESATLGYLLKMNRTIQVLDLSNNHIQNLGLKHIISGLKNQEGREGLEVFILWNNYLTDSCTPHLQWLLRDYIGVTVLNVGCNELRDSFLAEMKDTLKINKNLLRLGLQDTKLTCDSAECLADILRYNSTIERIDLRANCILVPGLKALSRSMDSNRSVMQIDFTEALTCTESAEFKELVQEINKKCRTNKTRQTSYTPGSELGQLPSHRATSRKISLTCQTLYQESFTAHPLLTEPKKVTGKLRSPAPSPIPSPVSSPVPPLTKSRFSVSRVSESDYQSTQAVSRFKVTIVEPPKSVTSNSGAITIGFDCQSCLDPSIAQLKQNLAGSQESIASSVSQDSDRQSDNSVNVCSMDDSYFNQSDETIKPTSPTETSAQCERIVQKDGVSSKEARPMTSIERLLSIFQTPTNLFTRNNQQNTTDEKESLPKQKTDFFSKQCDNIRFFPFSNTNISKIMSNTTIPDLPKTSLDSQSLKENISPEHSLTLTSPNKPKPNWDASGKLLINRSALDNMDYSGCSMSKGNQKPEFQRSQLCSSSEESDSGITGLELSTSSLSVTDSVISVDSVTIYDCSDSSVNQKARGSKSDLTNNNSWKPGENVDADSDVMNSQDETNKWQQENN